MRRALIGFLFAILPAVAQSPSMPVGQIIGSGVPAINCKVGQHYFRTDAVAGSNLYLCTALPNTWTQSVGGVGVTGSGTLNFLPRWDATGVSLVDSGVSDSGTVVTLAATRSLSLAATTSATTGVVFKGADRFIHNYKPPANNGFNVFFGTLAGNFTMTSATAGQSSYNTGVGHQALQELTTGYDNTAVGNLALLNDLTGFQNTAVGAKALQAANGGDRNTAVGAYSLFTSTDTNYNTAVGFEALYTTNGAGANGVAMGYQALRANTTAVDNVALGSQALYTNTTGTNNTAVGTRALYTNLSASGSTAVGTDTLNKNSTGEENSGFGKAALYNATAGYNTGLGSGALFSTTTGAGNTAVGQNSGYTETPANANVSGAQNTWIGLESGPGAVTQISNSIGIGYRSHPLVSNQAVFGNSGTTLTTLYGAVQWTTIAEGACAAGNRGQVVYVAGGGGVADTFRICRKDGADAYVWVALY